MPFLPEALGAPQQQNDVTLRNMVLGAVAEWKAGMERGATLGINPPFKLYFVPAIAPEIGRLCMSPESPSEEWTLASPLEFHSGMTEDQVAFQIGTLAGELPILAEGVAVTASAKVADDDEDRLEDLKDAVHGYWNSIAKNTTDYNRNNTDASEPLYYSDFLKQITVSDLQTAAEQLGLELSEAQAEALRQEIIDWKGEKFTEAAQVGIYRVDGELGRFEIGEVEEQLGQDDAWQAIVAEFGADYVEANYEECVRTYMGDMHINGQYGYVNLSYEFWVLVLNAEEVQADFLGSEFDPGAAQPEEN